MTPIVLKESEVPAGMIVGICFDGETELHQDKRGPLLLKAMMGGVPQRKKFYSNIERTVHHDEVSDPTSPKAPAGISSTSLEGFADNVRFIPTEVFTANEAPAEKRYTVFVEGVQIRYPDSNEHVYVCKYTDGSILGSRWAPEKWSRRPFPLPEGAILVPVGGIENRSLCL